MDKRQNSLHRLVQGVILYRCRFFLSDMDIHTVDFHILVGADHDILHTADNTGFDQVTSGRVYLDHHIRCLDLKLLAVDDILGMQVSFKAENFVVIHAEFRHIGIGNTAGRQNFLHILLADHEGFSHLGFLVHLDALADLLMDSLNHIQIAFIPQRGGQQRLKDCFCWAAGLGIGVLKTASTKAS